MSEFETELPTTFGEDMSDFRVDFSNVEDKNFDPMPAGRYLLAVTDWELAQIKSGNNAGKPRVQFEFTVQEPTHVKIGGVDTKVAERKLWASFFPTLETTLFMLKGFLRALGEDVDGPLNFSPKEIMAREYDDRLVVAKVKIQGQRKVGDKTYEPRNEIGQFYPASTWKLPAGAANKVAPSAADSLLP